MQIFTGIFPRHYDPPDGFTFEINDVSPPIQVVFVYLFKTYLKNMFNSLFDHLKDDILLFDYNVQERVNDFVYAALAQVRSS